MPISAMMLPEFDHEMANTRKVLERVPEDKSAFKPHAKSMAMGQLAGHIAEMVGWAIATMKSDSYDVAPKDGPAYQPTVIESRAQLLKIFDGNLAAARETLAGLPDEAFGAPWSLLKGGHAIFTQPRGGVLRGMVFQPHCSSPRPVDRLSPDERYSRSGNLRSFGRRSPVARNLENRASKAIGDSSEQLAAQPVRRRKLA